MKSTCGKVSFERLLWMGMVAVPLVVLAQNPSVANNNHAAPDFPGFSKLSLEQRRAVGIGSGPSFATEIHVELVEKVPQSMACSEVLARAQWRQDILLALDAKAHFDNCQFEKSSTYVKELI